MARFIPARVERAVLVAIKAVHTVLFFSIASALVGLNLRAVARGRSARQRTGEPVAG